MSFDPFNQEVTKTSHSNLPLAFAEIQPVAGPVKNELFSTFPEAARNRAAGFAFAERIAYLCRADARRPAPGIRRHAAKERKIFDHRDLPHTQRRLPFRRQMVAARDPDSERARSRALQRIAPRDPRHIVARAVVDAPRPGDRRAHRPHGLSGRPAPGRLRPHADGALPRPADPTADRMGRGAHGVHRRASPCVQSAERSKLRISAAAGKPKRR